MTETGWGEFEIQIKIFFQDPAEKPVTLFHHLRLYATNETIMGPQNSVISERYEEIVRALPCHHLRRLAGARRALNVLGPSSLPQVCGPGVPRADRVYERHPDAEPAPERPAQGQRDLPPLYEFPSGPDGVHASVLTGGSPPAWADSTDANLEKADLARMEDALQRVQEEMRTTKARHDKAEAEFQKLSREVAELEQARGLRPAGGSVA